MKTYYIWIATFKEDNFEQYWDNEPYENELKLFKEGLGAKPDSRIKMWILQGDRIGRTG